MKNSELQIAAEVIENGVHIFTYKFQAFLFHSVAGLFSVLKGICLFGLYRNLLSASNVDPDQEVCSALYTVGQSPF